MSLAIMPERAPYIQFEVRAIENRDSSVKEGRYIASNVDYVLITPAGSKDTVERRVDEWIADLNARVQADQISPKLVDHFKSAYELWKKGEEIPTDGTPISDWSPISPAERSILKEAKIRTVEDLAHANEAVIMNIGIGARTLQNKAKAWLTSASDHGKVAQEVASLKVTVEELERRLDDSTKALQEANSLIATLQPKGKRAA